MMESPIVVGALGGSGTRVVAQILEAWGIQMGVTLNESHDELLFTHLFKRPGYIHAVSDKGLQQRLRAYGELRTNGVLHRKEYAKWMREALDPIHGLDQPWVQSAIESYQKDSAGNQPWGWKEPNSHVILPHIASVFPTLKYVHVIRHGYAMAKSQNRQQLDLWGMHYGIHEDKIANDPIKAQFHYWRVANLGAKLVGEKWLKDRFTLLRFEDLIEKPSETLQVLAEFLGISWNVEKEQKAMAYILRPDSLYRYKEVTSDEVGDDGTSLPLFGY